MKKLMMLVSVFAVLTLIGAPVFAGGACPMGGAADCGPAMSGPMNCPPSSGGKVAQLLLALAAGYAVLALAMKQEKKTARIGKVIGWFIIVVSFVGMLCAASKGLCRMKAECAAKSAAACPMSGGAKAQCAMTGDTHDAEKSPVPGKK